MKKREEQIEIIIQNNIDDIINICSPSDEYIKGYTHGFREGAKWSDKHPHWMSVKDKLPEPMNIGGNFSKSVLVVINDIVYTGYYVYSSNRWVIFEHDDYNPPVSYWMDFPKFNDKEN